MKYSHEEDIESARSEASSEFFSRLENRALQILIEHSDNVRFHQDKDESNKYGTQELTADLLKQRMRVNYTAFSRVLVSLKEKGYVSIKRNEKPLSDDPFNSLSVSLTRLGLTQIKNVILRKKINFF
ncbi:hypothetical protein NO991_11860 [Pseudoalteromonas sp. DY56-GL22]|uniref:hypothetical protein n=1 Tax=Pseudoalteromonas sp. DY56-GL22 TaxID=2967126 RepID=UPI00352B7776